MEFLSNFSPETIKIFFLIIQNLIVSFLIVIGGIEFFFFGLFCDKFDTKNLVVPLILMIISIFCVLMFIDVQKLY